MSNVLFLVAMILIALLSPLGIIWSMNVLFPSLAIPYTWETWLAVLIMSGFFKSSSYKSK